MVILLRGHFTSWSQRAGNTAATHAIWPEVTTNCTYLRWAMDVHHGCSRSRLHSKPFQDMGLYLLLKLRLNGCKRLRSNKNETEQIWTVRMNVNETDWGWMKVNDWDGCFNHISVACSDQLTFKMHFNWSSTLDLSCIIECVDYTNNECSTEIYCLEI